MPNVPHDRNRLPICSLLLIAPLLLNCACGCSNYKPAGPVKQSSAHQVPAEPSTEKPAE
jgi:hypothetical protein